jgi:hypothetical protein
VGRSIEKAPTTTARAITKPEERHHILSGSQLNKVNAKRPTTSPILQSGPARTGESKNITTQENFNLGSSFLNHPELPATYCPIGIFLNQSITF